MSEGSPMTNGLIKTAAVFIPLIRLLNGVGVFVAGIWLAINGDWWAIGYGLAVMLAGHFLVGFLILPSVLLGVPAMKLSERGKHGAARILLAGTTLYISALMAAWCVAITIVFLNHSRHSSLFPMLLWTYAVATATWNFMSTKDQQSGGNEFSIIACIFLQAGYIVGALALMFTENGLYFVAALVAAMAANWLLMQALGKEAIETEFPK